MELNLTDCMTYCHSVVTYMGFNYDQRPLRGVVSVTVISSIALGLIRLDLEHFRLIHQISFRRRGKHDKYGFFRRGGTTSPSSHN